MEKRVAGGGYVRQAPRIRERLRGYRFWSGALMAIFVTLGILSVICALAAATFTKELQDLQLLKITILVPACCSALITAFNLQGKSSQVISGVPSAI